MVLDPNNPNKNPYGTGYEQVTQSRKKETTYKKKKVKDDDKQRDVSTQKKDKSRSSARTDKETVQKGTNKETVQKGSEESRSSATEQARQKVVDNRHQSTIARSKQEAPESQKNIESKHPTLKKPSDQPAIKKEVLTGQKQQRPGEMKPQQLLSQLTNAANSFTPAKGSSFGSQMEAMVEEFASQSGEDPKQVKKQASQFINGQQQNIQQKTTGRFNGSLNKMIKQLPQQQVPGKKETAVNQQSMNNVKNFPELNKQFQTTNKDTVDKFNEFQNQAKESLGEDTKTMRTFTKSSDEPRGKMLSTFNQQVENSNLPERDKNILNRMFAGQLDSPEKSKQVPENLRDTFNTFMGKAKEAGQEASQNLKNMLPEGTNPDFEGVKATFQADVEAEQFINEQLPDVDPEQTSKEFKEFKENPSEKSSISPRHLRVYQQAHAQASTKHSTLAAKNTETFTEGWTKEYDKQGIAKDKKFTESEAKALRDPASALVKNKELLKNQKEIVQVLTNAGLNEIEEWPKKYKEVELKTRGVVDLLTSAPKELVEKLKKGEISFSEFMEQMGKPGKDLLKKIGHNLGKFQDEEFEPDSEILEQVLETMDSPRMKPKYQAARFGQEFISGGQEFLNELKQAKTISQRQGAIPGISEKATTTSGSESADAETSTESTEEYTFGGVSTFQYQVAMQSFNNKMSKSMTTNQISDINASGDVSRAKRTAGELQKQESIKAQKEAQKSQEDQGKGIMGKIFGSIKLVLEITVGIAVLATGIISANPGLMLLGATLTATMTVGAIKNIADNGWWDAASTSIAGTLASGLECYGVPDDVAMGIAATVTALVEIAVVVALTVVAIVAAIPSGGASLAFWAVVVVPAIVGALLLAASSFATIGASWVEEMGPDGAGVFSEDTVDSVTGVMNQVALWTGVAGFFLCLPAIIVELPSMARSVANFAKSVPDMLSSAATSMGDFVNGLFRTADTISDATELVSVTSFSDDAASLTSGVGSLTDDALTAGSESITVSSASDVSTADQLADVNQQIDTTRDEISKMEDLKSDIKNNPDEVANMNPETGAATYGMTESQFSEVQQLVQEGNTQDALDLIRKMQKEKLKHLDELIEQSMDLEMQITRSSDSYQSNKAALDDAYQQQDKNKFEDIWKDMSAQERRTYYADNPDKRIPLNDLYSKQMDAAIKDAGRFYSDSDWNNMRDTYKEIPQDARESMYMNASKTNPDKAKILDRLNYDLSEDPVFKAKYKDAAKKMKSDLELKKLKSVMNTTKAWVDFGVNAGKTINSIITGERQIKAAKHQLNAEMYAADAERLASLVNALTSIMKQEEDILKQDAEDMEVSVAMANALISSWSQLLKILDVDPTGLVSKQSGATTT